MQELDLRLYRLGKKIISLGYFMTILRVLILFIIGLMIQACGSGSSKTNDAVPEIVNTSPDIIDNTIENQPPIVNVNTPPSVQEGTVISLDGSSSNDSDGQIVLYQWSQVENGAELVTILDSSLALTSLVAPAVTENTIIKFTLTVTDNLGAVASVDTQIIIKPTQIIEQPITAQINLSRISGLEQTNINIISGSHEIVQLGADGSADFNNTAADETQIIMALDDSEELLLLGLSGLDEEIELNPLSTATSLIMGYPGLMKNISEDTVGIVNRIKVLPEIIDLANLIEKRIAFQSSWWDEQDSELIELIITAIQATKTEITPSAVSLKTSYGALSVETKDVDTQGLSKLYLSPMLDGQYEDKIAYEIENAGNRWVSIYFDGIYSRQLLIEESKTAPFEFIPSDFTKTSNGEITIQAYGPGVYVDSLPSSDWPRVIEPTVITMINGVALPFIKAVAGKSAASCVLDWFNPLKDQGLVVELVREQPDFQNAAEQGNLNKVALDTLKIISNKIAGGYIDCAEEESFKLLIKKLIPVYGNIDLAWSTINLAREILPVISDLSKAPVYKEWVLTNELNIDVEINSSNIYLEPKAVKVNYEGDCPEDTICRQFVFQSESTKSIEFDITCLDDAVCKSVKWNYGDEIEDQSNDPAYIAPHIYSEFGEYALPITVTDYDGATVEKRVIVKLVEARPSIEVTVNDIAIRNNEVGYLFGEVDLGSEEKLTVTITNTGNSDLKIAYILFSSYSQNFSVSQPLTNPIPSNDSTTFELTYNPVNLYEVHQARVKIESNDESINSFEFIVSGKEDSYTKISNTGEVLFDSAEEWACVRDDTSGFIWEVKTGFGTGLHAIDNVYRWGGVSADMKGIETYGDWNILVDGTNSEKLCGYSDWRLPRIDEIAGPLELGGYSYENIFTLRPAFSYFHNTATVFWSATDSPKHVNPESAHIFYEPGYYWRMNGGRYNVVVNANPKDNKFPVRLVRGGQ